jgi:hypothetical protein
MRGSNSFYKVLASDLKPLHVSAGTPESGIAPFHRSATRDCLHFPKNIVAGAKKLEPVGFIKIHNFTA